MSDYRQHTSKAGTATVSVGRYLPEKYVAKEYVTEAMRDESEQLLREVFAMGYQRAIDDSAIKVKENT